jgi:alpha-1,3-rhamnosyl/mannosyltransferase
MNIVFDARVIQDHFPGIGRYAYNLLAELPAQLHGDETLTVLHDPSAKNTRLPTTAQQARTHAQVRWVAWPSSVFGVGALFRQPPAASQHVVHFPYYLRPLRAGAWSVTTIFDTLFLDRPNVAPSSRARLANWLLNGLAIVVSNRVITASQHAARALARHYPAAQLKTSVISIAADPIFSPRDVHVQHAAREKFGLPQHFALYLASNKPHKNLVRLVEAWALLCGEGRETSGGVGTPHAAFHPPLLVVAGHQDPRYPEAQLRAQALGIESHITFIGAIGDDDAAALYSACDVFVYPSLYEGFGLTPLEAMACGAPVVCSNATSLPEVTGDAALLFDPTKPNEIAQACVRVLANPPLQAKMRAASLAQARRFSWSETAQHTIALYRAIGN